MQLLVQDDFTVYEGEVDQLGRPSGCGCLIQFTQPIRGIPFEGESHQTCVLGRVRGGVYGVCYVWYCCDYCCLVSLYRDMVL